MTVQRGGLQAFGVDPERIYVEPGLTGANRARPACKKRWPPAGPATPSSSPNSTDSPRSLPDAGIADELTGRQVKLSFGGSVYDPPDTVGRLLFNVLAMVAELRPTSSSCELRRAWRPRRPKGRLHG